MREEDIVLEEHFFHFPYAHVIFGMSFPLVCQVIFGYTEIANEEGYLEPRIHLHSLTGSTEDGMEYDMAYLGDNSSSRYADFVVQCLLANREYWDDAVDEEEGEFWWERK